MYELLHVFSKFAEKNRLQNNIMMMKYPKKIISHIIEYQFTKNKVLKNIFFSEN